jgi:hypothetical protein
MTETEIHEQSPLISTYTFEAKIRTHVISLSPITKILTAVHTTGPKQTNPKKWMDVVISQTTRNFFRNQRQLQLWPEDKWRGRLSEVRREAASQG